MRDNVQKATAVASSALLLASMGAAGAVTLVPGTASAEIPEVVEVAAEAVPGRIAPDVVAGVFAYNQGEITSTDAIARIFPRAASVLCAVHDGLPVADAAPDVLDAPSGEWRVAVCGAVGHAYTATLDEMAEEGTAQLVMGCTCAGNPADGNALANGLVTGVTLRSIMEAAQVDAAANTVVFSSSDGYEVALPLSYVKQRFSLLAYAINGEPIANSVGGANQLWLGSTAASYFARDVVAITFEARQTPPPAPGTSEAGDRYANVPGIGIAEGGEAA